MPSRASVRTTLSGQMQQWPEQSEEWWQLHNIIFDALQKPWLFPCVQRPDATSCPDEEAQANYRELADALKLIAD